MSGAVVLLPSRPSPAQRDMAALLAQELTAQAVPTSVVRRAPPPREPGSVPIVLGARERLVGMGADTLGGVDALGGAIVIADDPPDSLGDPAYLELLRRAGAVFVLDDAGAIVLRRSGVAARVLRLGYVAARDRYDAAAERPVDIAVCGEPTARRTAWAAAAGPVLSRHSSVTWLRAEEEVLSRARVAVYVHPEADDPRLRWQDVLPAIHAGAAVVAEHATGLAPLVPGEHVLVAGVEALAYVAEGLLTDGDRLAALREAAHRRIVEWLPFSLSASEVRIAIVRLAGCPAALASPAVLTPAPHAE